MLLPATLAIAIVAGACKDSGSNTAEENLGAEGGAVITTGGTEPATTADDGGGGGATGAAGTGAPTGLPCDVQGVIENRCIACHSGTAPPPLLKFEHLVAKSIRDPAKTLAEVSVQLMKTKEMPPAPAVPAEDDEIAAFENWVKDGSKQNPNACTDMPRPDGGVADGGGGGPNGGPLVNDAGLPLGDGGCTSGKKWTQGNEGSPLMHPGGACNACHQQAGGPNLRIAGTVFPTLREPIDCVGSAPPPQITVTITDSRKPQPRVITLDVNASGNFSTQQRLTLPIKAMVKEGDKTRAMQGTVNSGDCNSCHTQAGLNGAPGRILAPN